MIRTCKICGKEFDTNGTPAKCCSKECMEVNRININKKCTQAYKERHFGKKKKRNTSREIIDITVEARKQGMTYGQYVAQMYLERGC